MQQDEHGLVTSRFRRPSMDQLTFAESASAVMITADPYPTRWTAEEDDALCAGVEKHFFGNWLAILTDYQFTYSLANRSNINLKDKWRTLSKSSNVSNSKKKVMAHRIVDLMHPHQHSTKKISEKRKVEAVSDSQDCPVKEVSDPQNCQVKEVSDPQDCPVDEVSDPQDCPVEEVSDLQDFSVEEVIDSQDCPADEISETHGCPVDEVSDSQYCPVDEDSESDVYLIEELNSQDHHSSSTNTGQRRVTRSYMLWLSFSEDKKSSFTYIDPLWYNLYLNDSNKEKALNWIKKKDIFCRKYVFVLIFQCFGSKLKTPCILLLDSLEKADHSKQLETAIRKFVLDIYGFSERKEDKRLVSKMPFLVPKVPRQIDQEESKFYALALITTFMAFVSVKIPPHLFVIMSVHNSEPTPINSDHDDDIHDSVTRISKLDISDPLHLHPNDTTAFIVVSIKLKGTENYQVWSCAMLLALEGKNKIGFIDGSCKRSNTDEVLGKQWDRVNAIVLGWILNSISEELFLDDSYMQIRSSIMSRETLPYVRSAYATISSEESHRVVVGSIAGSSQRNQASAFVSNANMAGANQHMTYSDKELDNVVDISHLKINFGHLNGTEAFISKIENLKLSNGLTLYDVMVIPEYYVTLISVHKMAKENKIFVVFDKSKCYFVNQDLNLKNILGTGDQCEGLYYYNEQEPVMNVLKKSLNFDKADKDLCCEFNKKIKVFRNDNGTEFVNQYVSKFCADKEGIPLRIWSECILTATYLINRLLSSVLNGKSHYEMIYRKCPSLSHLRVFGCLCFATLVNSSDKFGSISEKYVLIGYSSDSDKIKDATENVFQDVNHINFFDLEYPKIPNDDERVDPNLNCDNKKSHSASSSSSESGGISVTADFPINSGNDADSSDNNFAT
ncbi:ribonuclease H-like domain-containing protein [Tanacetum coccineum]|uniref:Ribonuclease H-like domain-containing protein n=1 Tax=Tanacetum coccineum TaxID=301880 RepID=A0ABQ4XDU6_9ASTR